MEQHAFSPKTIQMETTPKNTFIAAAAGEKQQQIPETPKRNSRRSQSVHFGGVLEEEETGINDTIKTPCPIRKYVVK